MTIFKIEFQNNKKSLITWIIILVLVMGLMMSIFPSMRQSGLEDLVNSKLDALPENILKAFHLNSGPSLSEPTGYFAYIFQYLFIAASIFSCMLGTKALIKEEVEGTIEFLYAQPVSRIQIVLSKIGAAFGMVTCFWLCLYVAGLGTTLFFNQGAMPTNEIINGLTKIYVTEFFVLLFFISLGFLFSSVSSTLNQGLSMGVVFAFYLAGIVGDLQDKLSFFKNLSPIAKANPAITLSHPYQIAFILVLLGISFLCLLCAIIFYNRKDLQVS